MKKYKAGRFYYDKENRFEYYTDDFETFYEENDIKLTDEDLEDWAAWLNSPWSYNHESYTIKVNCKNAYSQIDENEPMWKCEYSIIGYDGIEASVFGYGNTEEEALEDCKINFQVLQYKYNPKKYSF